jgi:hypothetical protein
MSEGVYDRCQRTTELIEGRVPCRIGLKPVFSVVDLAGICLIALIRQRSKPNLRVGWGCLADVNLLRCESGVFGGSPRIRRCRG